MSLVLLSQEIDYFLSTSTPEVLCITGRWGVGKTYAWNARLKARLADSPLPLKRYAYVSLFGQSSLDEVRNTIWENSVASASAGALPSFETIDASVKTAREGWRKVVGFSRFLPGASEYAGFGARAAFLMVREQFVCVDDFERLGAALGAKEVLGLISFLKEQRRCKVVLLLNQEALTGAQAADFKEQLEKVADVTVTLDPTPAEAAAIGVNSALPYAEYLKERCTVLGIVNIRTIKKVERMCGRTAAILEGLDPRVVERAIHSLVLFVYCRYEPDLAPRHDLISTYNTYEGLFERETRGDAPGPDDDALALLRRYEFSGLDEFDLPLLEGVQRGGFDSDAVRARGQEFHDLLMLRDMENSFSDAWQKYHESFDDNADEVIEALDRGLRANVAIVSPSGLDATVRLMKDLGLNEQAERLITFYFEHREGDRRLWDLSDYAFHEQVQDPAVIQAFADKLASLPDDGTPLQSLYELSKNDGFGRRDIERVATLSADDFYALYHSLRGSDLRRAVEGARVFRRIGNPDPAMTQILRHSREALQRIAAETPINARRVKLKYGIEPDAVPTDDVVGGEIID